MSPRPSVASFSVADTAEVVCPLTNTDGSRCRKRCVGVRASASMWPGPGALPPSRQAAAGLDASCCPGRLADSIPQEKRYRSMQEHIRRAHPRHYIARLPATEESFRLMVDTPLDQRAAVARPPAAPPRRSKP